MAEKEDQRTAFELYLAMGPQRTLRKTAEEMGRSHSTINYWAHKFRWSDRIKAVEAGEADPHSEMLAGMQHEALELQKLSVFDADLTRLARTVIGTIDSLFDSDERTGKITPHFVVEDIDDFNKLVNVLDKLVRLKQEVAGRRQESEASANNLNVAGDLVLQLDRMSDEQKLSFLAGKEVNIPDVESYTRADEEPAGELQETGHYEVLDGGAATDG